MEIVIYGKSAGEDGEIQCSGCVEAREKIAALGFEFEYKDIDEITQHHEGWRNGAAVEVRAALAMNDEALPLIAIDKTFFDLAGALEYLEAVGRRLEAGD